MSEENDQVNPLDDLIDSEKRIKIDVQPAEKSNGLRDSLEWMKQALDECSSKHSSENSEQEMSDDSGEHNPLK